MLDYDVQAGEKEQEENKKLELYSGEYCDREPKQVMAEKKGRQKGKREKQMEEKAGRNGSFTQVGWRDGWRMENLFVLHTSSLF